TGTWWNFTTVNTPINVAAAVNGGTATASSSYSAGYGPSGTIDGNRTGVNWGSGGGWNDATPNTFADWLQVDFLSPQTINEIDVFTVQDLYATPVTPTLSQLFTLYGLTDFQVQYWDGTQWLVVPGGSVTGNANVWRQFSFAPLTTARIRIWVTGARAGYSRITEVEASTTPGGTVPAAFAKSTPAAGTTTLPVTPTLTWTASSGATSYEYCVDTTNNNS